MPENIQCVIHPQHQNHFDALTHLPKSLRPICYGGKSRAESVQLGIKALTDTPHASNNTIVLIHDAARPWVSLSLLERLISTIMKNDLGRHFSPNCTQAVIPIVPIADALKKRDDYLTPVERHAFALSQTPQVFLLSSLCTAYRENTRPLDCFDDEAALFASQGIKIATVEGDLDNRKITFSSDLPIKQTATRRTVFGTGFDLHRYDTNQPSPLTLPHTIMVAGQAIGHDYPLIGHSDGDVVLHALCDAIYGTIAAGDIGQHFPPNDPQWKDCHSRLFVQHALSLLHDKGGVLRQIDATIIADTPKITPLRSKLCTGLAKLCDLPINAVSLKATTTEGLGFIDARHAIAAQVMISVDLYDHHCDNHSSENP